MDLSALTNSNVVLISELEPVFEFVTGTKPFKVASDAVDKNNGNQPFLATRVQTIPAHNAGDIVWDDISMSTKFTKNLSPGTY